MKGRFWPVLCLLLLGAGCSPPDPSYQGKPVSQWIKRLDSKDANEQQRAIAALAASGDVAIERLTAALDHPDTDVSFGAACALIQMGPNGQRQVERAIDQINSLSRMALAQAFFHTNVLGPKGVAIVSSGLQDEDPMVRHQAVFALGVVDDQTTTAIPPLIDALRDPKAEIRWRAAFALIRTGRSCGEFLPQLIAALQDPDDRVRLGVVQVLGAIGEPLPTAIPPLKATQDDANAQVRFQAAEVLQSWEVRQR